MQKGLTSVKMIKMKNRIKRMEYAISVFILAFALLIISIPFIPLPFIGINTFNLTYIYNIISDNFLNFFSIFLVEISLISVFTYMITNQDLTKKKKHKIIITFIALMIFAYLVFAYIYPSFYNFEPFSYVQFKTSTFKIPLSRVIYYDGNFIPAKLYMIYYNPYLPPFYHKSPNFIGQQVFFNVSNLVCLTSFENRSIKVQINYKIVNQTLISQESITAFYYLPIEQYKNTLVIISQKYLLTLEPEIKNATILNTSSINSTLLNEHNVSYINSCLALNTTR